MRRTQFGRSSEKIDAEIAQLTLALEDLETGIERSAGAADAEPPASSGDEREKPARRPLPEHLPHITVAHDIACACPRCGGAWRPLGEDVTEVLDYVPASFRVIRHVRPKFSCRLCESITPATIDSPAERPGGKWLYVLRRSPTACASAWVGSWVDHGTVYKHLIYGCYLPIL